jgi:hypothetical protein
MCTAATWSVILAVLLTGALPIVEGAAGGGDIAPADRFVQDTVYHAVVDVTGSTITVFYGPFVLVSCPWSVTDNAARAAFGDSHRACGSGWHTVTGRRVWSGQEAVPQRLVRVVTRTVTAEPELVARVMPERFQVDLAGALAFRIMTARGAGERRTFGERWRRWIAHIGLGKTSRVLEMIVSPEDAQTLYYALEPGTPVIIRSDDPNR